MKKLFFTSLLIASLTFTGCTSKNYINTENEEKNINTTSENTVSNQYDVSGYWKVSSEEMDTGYYLVEFKDNNTMIEYFPKNNALKSTYDIQNSSSNSLTILTASGTLFNLQKIDDLNMNLIYDTVVEHATRVSKADFNKLLNDLCEKDTIIYNSNYYQKYDKNYNKVEENEIKVEENYTNIEQNNISVEENYTNIEQNDIDIEQNDTYIEENDIYIEENDTSIEENDIYIEQEDTTIEENDIYIEQEDTTIEENNTYIEQEDTAIEEDNSIEENSVDIEESENLIEENTLDNE